MPRTTALLRAGLQRKARIPSLAFAALRQWAQRSTERRQAAIRQANLKQDRQLHRALAFTGRGE